MANRIPESTNVEAKLARWLYMKDVVIIFAVFVIGYFLQMLNIVPAQLTVYLYILEIFIALILLIRPPSNPKRRSFRVFMLAINKDRNTYSEIPYSLISKSKEGEENATVRKQTSYKDYIKKKTE
jgi:hypothetical protein